MKAYNINDFAALIGIDWADTKHDICEHPINTQKYHYCIIKSKPEALHDWAMSLNSATQINKFRGLRAQKRASYLCLSKI